MFRDLLKTDIKLIIHKPVLISGILIPFLLVLILKFIFPFISVLISSESRLLPDNYFTIISLTLIFSIPMAVGILLASGFSNRNLLSAPSLNIQKEIKVIFLIRAAEALILSFILVLIPMIIADPVPSEGWLRIIYISALLAIQSVNILFLITNRIFHKAGSAIIYLICILLLIAIPVGLLLKSPFNCLAFFSPLYWISWGWITKVVIESIISGAISVIIISVPVFLIYRKLFDKKAAGANQI
jgi:hypothetical protein